MGGTGSGGRREGSGRKRKVKTPDPDAEQLGSPDIGEDARSYFAKRGWLYKQERDVACRMFVGILKGLVADQRLNDGEIAYLHEWLQKNDAASCDAIAAELTNMVKSVVADGIITEAEREYLIEKVTAIAGNEPGTTAHANPVASYVFDHVDGVTFEGCSFCFTGDFAHGERDACERAVNVRGGIAHASVTKQTHYLVVGKLGSPYWSQGSYGTKTEHAVRLKQRGAAIIIIPEDVWTAAL